MNKFKSVISAVAVGFAASSVSAEELRMLVSFPENLIFTQEIGIPFAELIEEESGGDLTVAISYPDAVPPLEQFEPVQSGVFDMLFTHPAYHAGISTLGVAVDGIKADPAKRRETGVFDFIDEFYTKMGLRVLGLPPMGSKPFYFYVKEPVAAEPAFDGRKIRGTISYHPVIEALGGTGVVMGTGDAYAAMQKGVVDGAAGAAPSALGLKWHEVADYRVEQGFGSASLYYLMNADSWDALSDDAKAAITRAAIRMEDAAIANIDVKAAEEREKLAELGMKTTRVSDAEAAELDTLWAEGVWAIGMKGEPEATAALRELAREAGLSD